VEIKYHPSKEAVESVERNDDPLLVLVAHDRSTILVGGIDTYGEHYILLKSLGYPEQELDKFFRIVLSGKEASWTFVCPESYKGIADRERRIKTFYDDGIDTIGLAVKELGFSVPIDIPTRYKRHMQVFKEHDHGMSH
jgi:hypothetical protein